MVIKLIFKIIISCLLIIPVWVNATDALFLATEQEIIRKKITELNKIPKDLKFYSLYPYLELLIIKNNFSNNPIKDIDNFYHKYKNQPVTKKLNYYWVYYLYQNKRWADIVKYYQNNNSTKLKCIYTLALENSNPKEINTDIIKDLWLYDASRPSECDDLFDIWLKNKKINNNLIWERINLAIEKNNSNLVKYLGSLLSITDNKNIVLWLKVNQNPELITKKNLFNKSNPFHQVIIIDGLKKIAHKNIDKALRVYRTIKTQYKLQPKNKYDFLNYLAIKMYVRDHKLLESIINQIPYKYYIEKLYEISIKSAMKDNKWSLVITRISNSPKDIQTSEIWQYWLARSYDKLNKHKIAKKIYTNISGKISYYGLLACNRLKKFCPIEFTMMKSFKKDKIKLQETASINRAIELYKLNRLNQARIEWNEAVKNMNDKEKFIAANIASDLNWHDRTIVTAAIYDKESKENKENLDDEISEQLNYFKYPLGYKDTILQLAKQYKLDPAWIFAISRQESSFIKDAKSNVGAMGVMQLMPSTAEKVAKENNIQYTNKWNLLNENTNIKLGSAYLQEMFQENNGNPVLAAASYNAGPHNVKKWMNKYKSTKSNMPINSKKITKSIATSIDTDLWIELIPFYETRKYLKLVITNLVMYKNRLDNPPNLLGDIIPNQIKYLD